MRPVLLVFVLTALTEARRLGERKWETDGKAIPGVPGQDYPIFAVVPRTRFSCVGRSEGFYADPEARCQVFHICHRETRSGSGVAQSFLCPNGTIFNVRVNTCDWWNKVQCHNDDSDQSTTGSNSQTPAYQSLKTVDTYRGHDKEFLIDQSRRQQTEKVLLDNQVTESRIHPTRNNEYTKPPQNNAIHSSRPEYKNPLVYNQRIQTNRPAYNHYSSNYNPVTEVSIKPRIQYFTKSPNPVNFNLHSLNPIVHVARDSSLLSTFIDPSEERTTDSSPDRIRKPIQRYAVQGVLPQYENALTQKNPINSFSNDDSLQPDQENNRFNPAEGTTPSNFQSQEQDEGVGNPNNQSTIDMSTPVLNNNGATTQNENEFKVLSDSIDNPFLSGKEYIPPNTSINDTTKFQSNSDTIELGNTGISTITPQTDTLASLNGERGSHYFIKIGANVRPSSVKQNTYSENDSPQTIRVSSGYSFNTGNAINNKAPSSRFRVSGSYSIQDQLPTPNDGTGLENSNVKISEKQRVTEQAATIQQTNKNKDINNFGIVDDQEVKTLNRFIATEPDVSKSIYPLEDPNSNKNDESSEALTSKSFASTTQSDLELELMKLFGGINSQSDIPSSTIATSDGSDKENIPTTPYYYNPPTTDISIINASSVVFRNNDEVNKLTTVENSAFNIEKSPADVDGALDFNFKYTLDFPSSQSDGNVQTSETPIYYGQVTTENETYTQNGQIGHTPKPSDQPYSTAPKISGHFITKAPVDSKSFRHHYLKTKQHKHFDGYPPQMPHMVDGKYQYNAFSGDSIRTNQNLAPFPSLASNSPVNINRPNAPSVEHFGFFGGYMQGFPQQESYHPNTFIGASPSFPKDTQQINDGHFSQVTESGYKNDIPLYGFTANPTPFSSLSQSQNSGNYQRPGIENAFFLGNKPAFENSHLALPMFPPQHIFYSTYPDYSIFTKQTSTSSTQSPVTYPLSSKVPNGNNNFETIIDESIGSIALKDSSSQFDSSKVSSTPPAWPTISDIQTANDGISSLIPGSTISTTQPSVETYSTLSTVSSNGFESHPKQTTSISSPNFDQNTFPRFPTTQYDPSIKSTSNFPITKNLVGSQQYLGPTSPIPPTYSSTQTNKIRIASELPYFAGAENQSTNSIDERLNTSDFRTVHPPNENNFSKQSPIQDNFGSKSIHPLPTSTISSLGNMESSNISSEGVSTGNQNTFNVPSEVPFSFPKPFFPFGSQQEYLPPFLQPTILPHYSIPGRQLFTPMDLFSINNLPRPTETTISQYSSADIVKSISFSFDTSEEREAFELAQAKGLFNR